MTNKCKFILSCLLMLLMFTACEVSENQETMTNENTTGRVSSTTELYNASTEGTSTVEIDDVLYRNNFQNGLTYAYDLNYDSEPAFTNGYDNYFRLDCQEIELFVNINYVNVGESGSIFCRDDQWQRLHAYYNNQENFNFYCWYQELGSEYVLYPIADIDLTKFYELLNYYEKNSDNALGLDAKTHKLPYAVHCEPKYRFINQSKDELFSEGTGNFYLWKGKLYIELCTVSDDYMSVFDVPDELSQYFAAVIENIDKSEIQTTEPAESSARDYKKLYDIYDYSAPFFDTKSLLNGVLKLKKESVLNGEIPDTLAFYIPSMLYESHESPVSIKAWCEGNSCELVFYSNKTMKSSVTQLQYTPFTVDCYFTSVETQKWDEANAGIDCSVYKKYHFDKALLYLSTEVQADGVKQISVAEFDESKHVAVIFWGYIYPPFESDDKLAAKLYQDLKCVAIKDQATAD